MTGYWDMAARVCTVKELEALELHYKHGLSYRQIAVMLDLSFSTVRDRIKRAVQKISQAESEVAA